MPQVPTGLWMWLFQRGWAVLCDSPGGVSLDGPITEEDYRLVLSGLWRFYDESRAVSSDSPSSGVVDGGVKGAGDALRVPNRPPLLTSTPIVQAEPVARNLVGFLEMPSEVPRDPEVDVWSQPQASKTVWKDPKPEPRSPWVDPVEEPEVPWPVPTPLPPPILSESHPFDLHVGAKRGRVDRDQPMVQVHQGQEEHGSHAPEFPVRESWHGAPGLRQPSANVRFTSDAWSSAQAKAEHQTYAHVRPARDAWYSTQDEGECWSYAPVSPSRPAWRNVQGEAEPLFRALEPPLQPAPPPPQGMFGSGRLTDQPRRGGEECQWGRVHPPRNAPQPAPPKMATFAGKVEAGADWASFFMQFEQVALRYGWNPEESCDRLFECLRGRALQFVSDLPAWARTDYHTLVQRLQTRFGYRDPPTTKEKETLEEYAERAQKLATDEFPGVPMEMVDTIAVDAFLKGCRDKNAALAAMNCKPTTLEEATQLVDAVIHNYRVMRGGSNKPKLRVLRFEEDEAVTSVRISVPVEDEAVANLQDELRDTRAQLAEILSIKKAGRSKSPGRECFGCGQLGHFKAECPAEMDNRDMTTPDTGWLPPSLSPGSLSVPCAQVPMPDMPGTDSDLGTSDGPQGVSGELTTVAGLPDTSSGPSGDSGFSDRLAPSAGLLDSPRDSLLNATDVPVMSATTADLSGSVVETIPYPVVSGVEPQTEGVTVSTPLPLREVEFLSGEKSNLLLPVEVQGVGVQAVLDTASQVTVMGEDFFEKLTDPPLSTEMVYLKGMGN
ncbi:hypothetical protein CAPTEDRAFT_208062 [Capitella teleta]|uniref:CCHC-type domain-containing protein n=1 Tax=Capitella teleta TaxID=283909 RepID=R7UQL5_CAPTE|nr:hypothetical protein CAPTEDRAFT_208062 [Capitella teleta]|eukprot:ELU08475.1 hypothetical protein CAPTEDRAFT_208062 [Capitella teleta]